MRDHDAELRDILEPGRMVDRSSAERMAAVRQRMADLAQASGGRRCRPRTEWVAAGILVGLTTVGLAGTQKGRNLVRWIVTPIKPARIVVYPSAEDGAKEGLNAQPHARTAMEQTGADCAGPLGDFAIAVSAPDAAPFSSPGSERMRARMERLQELRDAGLGRLVALHEEPGFGDSPYQTTYSMEYAVAEDDTIRSELNDLDSAQRACAATLPLADVAALRDAGAGTVISEEPSLRGLGHYVIRFTLSDGQTVDVETSYPPGTRAERETVFAETRRLKAELRFTALDPRALPNGVVVALLRYQLADGRTVGIVEQVPTSAVSADGINVVLPEQRAPEGIVETGG